MMSICKKIKINNYTYFFILICALCGYLKNIMIILSICFIHELGHIFFIKLFNYEVDSIEILPFGGYTTIQKKINTSINKDLVIALGGVIAEIILLLFLFIFKNHFHLITYNLWINYNYILIIFNMLPIIPLDGNKIVHLLLEKFFSYQLSYKLNLYLSIVTLILFGFINYYFQIDNYIIITFLFYKIIKAYKNFPYLKNRFLVERYLEDFPYHKIDSKTKNIKDLKKEVLHYFREDKHYVKERVKIEEMLYKR